jgi:hypothetical protein
MRQLITVAALLALIAPAEAQQGRPQGGQRPPVQAQQKAPPQQPPAPLPVFLCRTAEEVCFLGIVTGKNEILVVFTNAPQAENIDAKPVAVLSGDSPGAAGSATPLDLAPHLGRVVMLTGTYDSQAGITRAELAEVASPLVSLMLKAQLSIDEPAQTQPAAKPQQKPRR